VASRHVLLEGDIEEDSSRTAFWTANPDLEAPGQEDSARSVTAYIVVGMN
jgi:hypothetical protein